MPRPATGAPRWSPKHRCWIARVSMPGKAEREPVEMPGIPREDKARAIALAKMISDRMRGGGQVSLGTGETANEWYVRYHAYQVELGQTDAVKKQSRWTKWIAPKIGSKAMAAVTRDDVEDIRDALDAAIEAWKRDGAGDRQITGKTAMNAWSCLTSSFKAATSSKRRDLRILDGKPNPCVGVQPPGDRESRRARRKTFLFPKEVAALLACEAIPLAWRVIYAIALYLYLRPGELRVLTFGDVLDDGVVSITKAWDYEDKKVKPPKTRNGVRKVPIEPALQALLDVLRKGKADSALVVPALSAFGEDHLAEQFRKHLKLAGVTRAELHRSTRTHVQSNFRSCRDSGITWLAIAGVGVDKIMRRAGHDGINTTMTYVKQAEDLTGDLGVPFGPLDALVDALNRSGRELGSGPEDSNDSAKLQYRRRESNPDETRGETPSGDVRSGEKQAESSIVNSIAPSVELPKTPVPEPERAPLSVDALRRKLDSAILAEAWVAVKAIRERMIEVERAGAGNVVDLTARRKST